MSTHSLLNSAQRLLANLGFWGGEGRWIGEVVAIVAAVSLLTLLLLVWASYFRRRRRRHSHHHAHDHGEQRQHSGHRRRRRHRHGGKETKRNPTLAETGGLPPARDVVPGETSLSE